MDHRSLGRSGLMVSPLAIGTFNFSNPTSETESIAIVERAYEAGVNFFDTSNNYNEGQSEIFLGHALRRLPARHKQAYFGRVMRITRSCAGTQSSISLTLSPIAWSVPPQQPQVSPAMVSTTSSRGR
jgi:aryl-alcohol dehydrogenase-like predicted oxidoreductase